MRGRPGLTDCDPDRWPLVVDHRDRDGGEVRHSSRPGPWLVECFSQSSGAPQDIIPNLFPGPPGSRTDSRLGELEGLQEKAWLCLLPHSPPDDHLTTNPWAESLPQWSLIVSYQWAVPSAALTNSWAGQLIDNRPMAEPDLLPSNRVGGEHNKAQQWLPAKSCAHPTLWQDLLLSVLCICYLCLVYPH